MAISIDKVDLFTQAMNSAFINSYNAIATPTPLDKALAIVPSGGRVENYPWMYPPPLLSQWKGYRVFAKLGETNYRIPNVTFSAGFEVPVEDLNDDQVGGYKLQAASMGQGAAEFHKIKIQQHLALGQTTACFDGSSFFANSHTVGTGDNKLAGTVAGSDGVTHAAVFLITADKPVKPLLWQNREAASLETDVGSLDQRKTRMSKWWTTMRGAPAFGFWWDAILVTWANTPTLAEILTNIGTVNATFRGFKYPKSFAAEPDQYPHANLAFNSDNLMVLCSTGLEHLYRQAFTLSLISQTENVYKGMATSHVSPYLDGVVAA
jgi:phage major head subunit gpT-like protein